MRSCGRAEHNRPRALLEFVEKFVDGDFVTVDMGVLRGSQTNKCVDVDVVVKLLIVLNPSAERMGRGFIVIINHSRYV